MTKAEPLTACKQYCLAAGATQGNIAYTQNVSGQLRTTTQRKQDIKKLNEKIKKWQKTLNQR